MDCYGKYTAGDPGCRNCRCRLSCRYYMRSEKAINRREHIVSFEAAQELLECADVTAVPGCENDPSGFREEMLAALGKFFRYLLALDDYALGIVAELVCPTEPGAHCTVSYLGKIHGCSRQAMHRKLMKMLGAHPELATLLRDTLYKLSGARQSFLRRRSNSAPRRVCP